MTQSLAVFDELLADVTVAVRPLMDLKVNDPASEQLAQSAAGQISGLLKKIEARRKDLLAPLKAQVDAINAAAKRAEAALDGPNTYVRKQLNDYSAELTRQRTEALRIQREKEETERRLAAEKRAKEEAELHARQETERKEREEAERAERKRIEDEARARQEQLAREAADRAAAADLFGGGRIAREKAAKDAADARAKAEAEELEARRLAAERAEVQRKALADQQERERIAEEARLQREDDERQKAADAQRREIEAQKVKGGRMDVVVSVVDAWAVPREFCRPPEVIVAEVKKAYKAGRKEIPGLFLQEEAKVSVRSESLPPARALA